jgi:hypothetical protein
LKDPRSTERLLQALNIYPCYYSKIRENIIYTLGSLREKDAVIPITNILNEADEIDDGNGGKHYISGQKEEAFWALGKIGLASLASLSTLAEYARHPSHKLRTCLAWTLGEIGRAQKEKLEGISADIIITLLNLMKTDDRIVFEESVSVLKKIGMPEFLHSLYFYNIGAVSILGLKPAQKGLFELSETIHSTIKTKGRAIIAVNGDSGTGKTYFCQAVKEGFGSISPDEILYMMRDRKKDQKVFNRILGLNWLKKYIEPSFYQDYSILEDDDDPDEYFTHFLKTHKDKKLIILDGCRDKHYFQRVIDLFYFKGELDIEVNFRATYSTRRFNLEDREIALESIGTHLAFLEEPALEDTFFYKEDRIHLYDLDNSLPNRLNEKEIQELFQKSRIDFWEELIQVGAFYQKTDSILTHTEKLKPKKKDVFLHQKNIEEAAVTTFQHKERKFHVDWNQHPEDNPFLLGTIKMEDIKPIQIRHYAQNQIAGHGLNGDTFIMTFLDNRLLSMEAGKVLQLTLQGRNLFTIDKRGDLHNTTFEKNEDRRIICPDSCFTSIAPYLTEKIITGHEDGHICIWNLKDQEKHIFYGHSGAVIYLSADYYGHIYSADTDGILKMTDPDKDNIETFYHFKEKTLLMKRYFNGKILVLTEKEKPAAVSDDYTGKTYTVSIFDHKNRTIQTVPLTSFGKPNCVHLHSDGRIFFSYPASYNNNRQHGCNLAVLSPGNQEYSSQILNIQGYTFHDFLVMGPRIIACGIGPQNTSLMSIWGTAFFVKHELSRQSLQQ